MWRKAILLHICFLTSWLASAQIKYNSPYSSLGLGDQYYGGFAVNKGMAGLGLSNANSYFINTLNPALLPGSEHATFEFGMRYTSHRLKTDNAKQSSSDGQIDYFALAFPLSKRAAMCFGLTPYTDVNYSTTIAGQSLNQTDAVIENYSGDGGVTRVFWSQGYTIFDKDKNTDTLRKHTQINLGLASSFLFGTINRNQKSQLVTNGVLDESSLNILRRERYRDVRFNFGTRIRKSINTMQRQRVVVDSVAHYVKKKRFSGVYGNLGFTYAFESEVETKTVEEFQQINAAGTVITADTLDVVNFNQSLPQIIGVGLSFDRINPTGRNKSGMRRTAMWTIGADAYFTTWPVSNNTASFQYESGYKFILGGEYASDLYRRNKEKTGVLHRYILKAGVRYEVLPYTIGGENVEELGISFGITSPLGPLSSSTLSNQAKFINLSLQYINRKSKGSALVDNIWLMSVSFTLNHKWFERRKFGL